MPIKTFQPKCEAFIETEQGDAFPITDAIKTMTITRGLEGFQNAWQVSLLPKRDDRGVSWYHMIAPGNYVSIKYGRFQKYWDNGPPNMRGFVEHVNQVIGVDGRGAPQRSYSVGGRDIISRLLNISRIYYMMFTPQWQFASSDWPYQVQQDWNIPMGGSPQELMVKIFAVAQNQLGIIQQYYKTAPDIEIRTSDSIEGNVTIYTLQQHDGPLAQLMSFFQNRPWNELYSANYLEKPTLIFRKTPWKDPMTDNLIQGDDDLYEETLGEPIIIDPSMVLNIDLTRAENEVRNWFFTSSPTSMLDQNFFKAAAASDIDMNSPKSNPYYFDHDDAYAGQDRFGYRTMDLNTNYFGFDPTDTSDARQAMQSFGINLCKKLNKDFAEASHYNSALESGMFVLQGNEAIQPGKYLKFGDAQYYITSVRDDLCFLSGREYFRTTAYVNRGTGFLKTMKKMEGAEIKKLRTISGRY